MKTQLGSRTRLATLIVALALLATACGSTAEVLIGDVASSDSESAVEPTSAPAAAEAATETPASAETDSDAADSEPADVVVAQESETETEEPEAVEDSVVSQVVATGGAVDSINGYELTLFNTVYTTSSPKEFVTGADSDGDESWLITEFMVTNDPATAERLENDTLTLRSPDGTTTQASHLLDEVGTRFNDVLYGVRSHRLFAAFEVPTPVSAIDDWDLVLTAASGGIPQIMPISGPAYSHSYPLDLVDGAESAFSIGTWTSCDNDEEFASQVASATLSVEGRTDKDEFARMSAGERIFDIDLDVTGISQNTVLREALSSCGSTHIWPDFVLRADGRPVQPFKRNTPNIDTQATFTLDLGFQVPNDVTTLELTGGADASVLATWELAMPPAVGEVEAELIPYRSKDLPVATEPVGDRASELTEIALSDGGARGEVLGAAVTIGAAVATSADLESFMDGSPEIDDDGRTYLIVEVDVENLIDQRRTFEDDEFAVVTPTGRSYGGMEIFDRTGEPASIRMDGLEFIDSRVAFETDGLVQDLSGWQLRLASDDDVPLELPLAGNAPEPAYPASLRPGDTVLLVEDNPSSICDQARMQVTVDRIAVDVEAVMSLPWGVELDRIHPSQRFVRIDLGFENLVEDDSLELCDRLSYFPPFLLEADGRLTQVVRREVFGVDFGEPQILDYTYRIPADTQTIRLLNGDGVIGTWQLRDAGQVLEDFGAEIEEEQTVISLNESVLFAFGESRLQQGASAPLVRVANILTTESTGPVDIIGHTDSIGDDDANQALSEARAEAVAAALIEAGVDADRLVVSGQGETNPVAPNTNDDGSDNPAGREQNRRVEVAFTSN